MSMLKKITLFNIILLHDPSLIPAEPDVTSGTRCMRIEIYYARDPIRGRSFMGWYRVIMYIPKTRLSGRRPRPAVTKSKLRFAGGS